MQKDFANIMWQLLEALWYSHLGRHRFRATEEKGRSSLWKTRDRYKLISGSLLIEKLLIGFLTNQQRDVSSPTSLLDV